MSIREEHNLRRLCMYFLGARLWHVKGGVHPVEGLYYTLKKNYGTHVIKLDIAPVAYPLGQHLFISASNNMFYRHSQ